MITPAGSDQVVLPDPVGVDKQHFLPGLISSFSATVFSDIARTPEFFTIC